ncbi:LysR family transcriptional regulator [Rhodopseudomonas boonkerdii]|uniref:LysR family transcriptional regulator n=1 Tax=Rhodopseudomonas boonkerdii TaxID=475937 RepID=UPI001E54A9CC|nr:LysR family transcriptional regulator [Rhodopseudomonas boonkerdii]UGV24718.1 LysR family transcriptional regulator [Rhodopseudomonas boonkerdii]
MTLDQLAAFVAVAERQHLTQAAAALNLSSSAVSSAIKALETMHGVALFHRVGRGIELTSAGRRFLPEAREMLLRARGAERLLDELAGIERGVIELQASQTIANYWLPPRLMRFHAQYPGIEVKLQLGNTTTVTDAVISGAAELGFIEGTIDEPALTSQRVASDRLMIVTSSRLPHDATPLVSTEDLLSLSWVMREPGSGTRSVFEAALRAHNVDPARLDVVMTLPSNEAVLSAVRHSAAATALSEAVVAPFLHNGDLHALPFALDLREFTLLRHKERPLSAVARAFETHCRSFTTSDHFI